MTKQTTISIITPAYNHGQFIAKCITSVRSQTYTDWEQIIVDDASSDDTYKIAASFAKLDKRIKVIKHATNWGIDRLADNYNQALKKARGKYVAILESDDYWPDDKLAKQVVSFNDKRVALSFGNCILVNKSGYPIKLFTYNENHNRLNNWPVGSILRLFYNLRFAIIPVTVIIKKSVLLKIGGFKKDTIYPFTDIPTFLRVAIEGRFAFVNEVLGYYRKQQKSYWFDFASKTSAMGREELLTTLENFLKVNKNNQYIKKLYKDRKKLVQGQIGFLRIKKIMKPISLFVNNVAFRGNINVMTLVFLYQYACYKAKKFLK